jgi:hypothetical protein
VNGGTIAFLAFLSLALVLPVAALRDRGLPLRDGWKMAAIWIALFALAAMLFGWLGL